MSFKFFNVTFHSLHSGAHLLWGVLHSINKHCTLHTSHSQTVLFNLWGLVPLAVEVIVGWWSLAMVCRGDGCYGFVGWWLVPPVVEVVVGQLTDDVNIFVF